eukprot:7391620-Prymnesium_polylepis.1
MARAHMHILRRGPALARLDGHEAVRLEQGGKGVALLLRLHAPPGQARAQVLHLLLMPRRCAIGHSNTQGGLVHIGLAIVAHQSLVAGRAQRCTPNLMEAALAPAAATAAGNLVACQNQVRVRRHLASERAELVVDDATLGDLVLLRHLLRITHVAGFCEDPVVCEVARQLLLHHSPHAVPRPLAVPRAAKVDPTHLEKLELAQLARPVVHHRARLEVEQPVSKLLIQHVLGGGGVVALLVGDPDKGSCVLLAVAQTLSLDTGEYGAVGKVRMVVDGHRVDGMLVLLGRRAVHDRIEGALGRGEPLCGREDGSLWLDCYLSANGQARATIEPHLDDEVCGDGDEERVMGQRPVLRLDLARVGNYTVLRPVIVAEQHARPEVALAPPCFGLG